MAEPMAEWLRVTVGVNLEIVRRGMASPVEMSGFLLRLYKQAPNIVEPILQEALKDPNESVRETVVRVLAAAGKLDAETLREIALTDEAENVRKAAMDAYFLISRHG